MSRQRLLAPLLILLLMLALPASVSAQTYFFSVPQEVVHVYLQNDGTLTLDYTITFQNAPKVDPIDAVDIGLPTDSYWQTTVTAEIDGQPIPESYIEPSPYVTYGLAVNLGEYAIPPGQSGTLHVRIENVTADYYPDTTDPNDASFQFSPSWFGAEFVKGRTDLSVSFHLPPGVGPNEARWHNLNTSDFPSEPETALDEEKRVTYTWHSPSASAAQQYIFGMSLPRQYVLSTMYLEQEQADIYLGDDGSVKVEYRFTFFNDSTESVLDELSVEYPYRAAAPTDLRAAVDDKPLPSPEIAYGTLDIRLGKHAIHPGQRKTVSVAYTIPEKWLTASWWDEKYTQAVLSFSLQQFSGNWLFGTTDIRLAFHLPPGMDASQVDWSASLDADSPPSVQSDEQGNVALIWEMPQEDPKAMHLFTLKMPSDFFPAAAIYREPEPSLLERMGLDEDTVIGMGCFASVFFGIIGLIAFGAWNTNRRKRHYLPPKIKIAGQGIKRGLTAVEAAVLMEQPADKVLTMILFSTVKKGAARVVSRDPLKIEVLDPEAKGLRAYEKDFLEAMQKTRKRARRKALQSVMVRLVRAVNKKMKGFNYRQTKAYYEKIIKKAWEQVQTADTPEVQVETLEKALPWTMLDEDFDDRSRRVFGSRPVYLPYWWSAYDPDFGGRAASGGARTPAGKSAPAVPSGGSTSRGLPALPGGEFAASVVTGIQNFSSQVVGNLTDFTGGVTARTNPIPKSRGRGGGGRSSGGGSSCACACACACAGCACACAGGGR